jgi:2-(1,2-epoxy-1,2-dihydrophenyl)acetyl-CoA isomerase
MSDGVLLMERERDVAVLRLHRPVQANALNMELFGALTEALESLAGDEAVAGVVITGSGRFFCGGGDLAMIETLQEKNPKSVLEEVRRAQRVAVVLAGMPVPTVAAVNGPAAGGGFDLALLADACVVAESAFFQSGFGAVGLVPDLGGSWLLPRVVGRARARRLVLGNERIDARTALDWGIAARVVPDADVVDAAVALAAEMAGRGTRPALAEAKRALDVADGQTLVDSLEAAAAVQAVLIATPEHRERTKRFFEASARRLSEV